MRTRFYPTRWAAAITAAAAIATAPIPDASALNIIMVETSTTDAPTADSDGSQLADMMEEVAQAWEAIILDSETVTIEFAYNDDIGSAWASAAPDTFHSNGRTATGHVNVNPVIDWWFDDNPSTHENFDMVGALYRDLGASEQAARFNPNDLPPDVLEVSYRGTSIAGTPADGKADAFTSLMHEVGHILGMHGHFSNSGDTDVETDAVFTGGNDFRAIFNETTDDDGNLVIQRGHFEWTGYTNNPLMCGGCAELNARRLPTAQDVICIASLGLWDTIDLPRKDFQGSTDTDFNTAANWIGNRVPSAGDQVYCRHAGLVKLSGNATMKTLELTNITFLETEGHDLTTTGDTKLITNANGSILSPLMIVEDGSEMETSDLDIGVDTIFDVKDSSNVTVNDDLTNEGLLKGDGTITVSDHFWNDGGEISPAFDGVLTLSAGPDGINLDGRFDDNNEENGRVEVDDGDLVLLSPLTDDFGGEIEIFRGRSIDFRQGWTLGTKGTLQFFGGPDPDNEDRAQLYGDGRYRGDIDVDGEAIIVSDQHSISAIDGSTYNIRHTFASDVEVTLNDPDDRLAVFGAEIEAGASFTGEGVLLNGEGSLLDLHDGADIGVKLTNGGRELGFGGEGTTGDATVERLSLLEIGTVRFDINDLPATGDFDHVAAVQDATCRGALVIAFNNLPFPPFGSRWRIIDAATRTSVFTDVEVTGLGIGRSARVEYFPDGVEVVIDRGFVPGQIFTGFPFNPSAGSAHHLPVSQGSGLNGRIVSNNPEVVGAIGETIEFRRQGVATLRLELIDEFGELQIETLEIVVGPPVTNCGLEAQLLHSAGQIDDGLGRSCALSGNISIGGAPAADPGGMINAGLGVIWERQAGTWTEVATLIPAGLAPGDRAGTAVEVDGSLALLGVPGRAGNNGEVRVFRRSPAGAWVPSANLQTAAVQAGRLFGSSIQLSGNFAFIGAPGDNGAGAGAGAVFAFERTGANTWTPLTVLRGSNTAAGDAFGSAIAWETDTLVVGAPEANGGAGSVYRFELVGGALVEQDILTLSTGLAGDRLGASVEIDVTASIVLAGAPGRAVGGVPAAGAVGVFEPAAGGGAWGETGLVTLPAPSAGSRFGFAVMANDCGLFAAAPWSDSLQLDGGAIHNLTNSGAGWSASLPVGTPAHRPGDLLGSALDGDGLQYASGSRRDDDSNSDAGAVYIWRDGAGGPGAGSNFMAQGDPAGWLDEMFPGGDPHGGRLDIDDDNDGRSRFLEYLQGGSPFGNEPPALTLDDKSQPGKRVVRYRLSRRAMQRYRLRMEWSESGTHWREDPALPMLEDNGDPDSVVALFVDAGECRLIGRVRVAGAAPQNIQILTNNENILTTNEN